MIRFKKILSLLLALMLTLTLFSGCGNSETQIDKSQGGLIANSDLNKLNKGPKINVIGNKANYDSQKEHTIMIYMVGSNLESQSNLASMDILEILESGIDSRRFNVVIYCGGAKSWGLNISSEVNTVLSLSASGSDFEIYGTTSELNNMGHPSTFLSFLDFAYESFPAENYSLICWDHGGGTLGGFGSDELFGGDGLTLDEMEQALDSSYFKNKKLSFLGFDACLMGTMETAEMAEDYANYLIASEELEPGYGWDYKALGILNSTKDTKKIADEIIKKYEASLLGFRGVEYTLSCIDLSQYDNTVKAMDNLFTKLSNGVNSGDYSSIAKARNNAYRFALSSNSSYELVDLNSFCSKLGSNYKNEASALINQLNKFVTSNRTNLKEAAGISVYIPYDNKDLFNSFTNAYGSDFYKSLSDSKGYCDFVKAFTNVWLNGEPQADYTEHQVETEPSVVPTPTPTPTPTAAPTATPAPTPTVEPTPEATVAPGSLTLQLSESQLNNLSSAYYTIFELSFDSATGKAVYTPVLKNIRVEPDSRGLIAIPQDAELVVLKTDLEEDGVIWPVTGVYNGGSNNYITLDTYLTATDDTIGGMESINAYMTSGSGNKLTLSSVISTEGSSYASYGKQDVNIDAWDYIAYNYRCYFPTYNAAHVLYPNQWWDDNGVDSYTLVPYNEEFYFEKANISDFSSNFYYQIVLEDTQGNLYGTELASFPTRTTYTVIRLGNMVFRVYDNYATLYSYNGDEKNVTIPKDINGVPVKYVEDYAFYYNSSLETLNICADLEKVGNNAFARCRNLNTVLFLSGGGIKTVGSEAFSGCKNLTTILLTERTTSIERGAFSSSGVLAFNVPKTVTHIGDGAFADCQSLVGILIGGDPNASNSNYKVVNGILYSADGSKLLSFPAGGSISYDIPSGVTEIAPHAFDGAANLSKVNFPNTLKVIDSYAFYDCGALNELNLPDSLEYIGNSAFASFSVSVNTESSVKKINIGPKVSFIGNDAFDSFPVEEYFVDSSNQHYSSVDGCLLNKSGTQFIKAPYMYENKLTIPDGVNEIKWHALSQCDYITELIIPDSVVSINEDIGLPDSLKKIEVGAGLVFWGNISDCHYYDSIKISSKNSCFVLNGGNIYSKDMTTLYYAEAKENVTVSEGVLNIELTAFAPKSGRNDTIKKITLPSSLTYIESDHFINLLALEEIKVNNNSTYQSEDGVLYGYDFGLLIHCPQGKTGTVTVNSKVVTIYNNAFYYNIKIEKVIVPEGIAAIKRGNFMNYAGENTLTLELPSSLTEIYPKMLRYADKFTVKAPSGSTAYNFAKNMGVNVN